ncbi:MAG: hypothetical protein DRJ38_02960 [Thermoprotei archaeon]|nr:MAG: hypothetical protein DRJ38_02960 [Thermoprotei archaeon]
MNSYRYIEKRINIIVELIKGLDSFRAGAPRKSISKLEEMYTSLKLRNPPYKWKELAQDLKSILDIPKSHPGYKKLVNIHQVASFLSYASIGTLILSLYFAFREEIISFLYAFAATFIVTNISFILRIYEAHILSQIFKEKSDILEEKGRKIKEMINYLLVLLRRELRKIRRHQRGIELNLYQVDYDNIQVVKKPSFLRNTYLVKVQ